MPGTYGKTWWRDGYACGCMIQSIEDVIEPRLRDAGIISGEINVYQQSYNSSVDASAGTHGEGGALDGQRGGDKELRIWRECGVAMWPRGDPYDSMDIHQHGVWLGCPHLSDEAADQAYDYKNGKNGLANNGSDPGPDVPYITWQDAYDKYKKGIFGMTDIEKPHMSDAQLVPADGEWHLLRVNEDGGWTLLTGPSDLYLASVHIEVTGLAPGQAAQVRLVVQHDDTEGDEPSYTEHEYPITEIIGPDNGPMRSSSSCAYGDLHWLNNLGDDPEDGWKTRLRLMAKAPAGQEISVTDVWSRIAH
jgi:hypothetical protein